jgi:hypothetical protein
MLCIALLFVFTQASVASSVGDVEHLLVGQTNHQHMLFSDINLDFDHHDGEHHSHHHDGPDDGDHDAGQVQHHHHHGDLGSSVFLSGIVGPYLLPDARDIQQPALDRFQLTARHSMLERPPKPIITSV